MKGTSFASEKHPHGQAFDWPLPQVVVLPFWAPATFKDNQRSKATFLEAHAIGFDLDQGQTEAEVRAIAGASGYAYALAASRNHQREKNGLICDRLRLVMPLSRPASADEYRLTHEVLRTALGLRDDPGARDPTRGWFGCREVLVVGEGKFVEPIAPAGVQPQHKPEEPIRNPELHCARALQSAIEELKAAGLAEEQRDKTMARNAYGIGRLVGRCGLDEDKVIELLTSTAIEAGYDPRKALDCCRRQVQAGMKNPREVAAVASVSAQAQAPDLAAPSLTPQPPRPGSPPGPNSTPAVLAAWDAYRAWMRALRLHCDTKLVVVTYDDAARALYRRVGERRVSVLGSVHVQAAAVKKIGEEAGLLVPTSTALAFVQDYLTQANSSTENPKLYDSGSGLYRWELPHVEAMPTPTWDGILERLSDPEAFLAHVWSAVEPRYEGRQLMWLQGEGNDGKTIMLKALFDGARIPYGIAHDDDLQRASQFLFASLWDRPVCLVGDSKSVNLMMLGLVQCSFSGGRFRH